MKLRSIILTLTICIQSEIRLKLSKHLEVSYFNVSGKHSLFFTIQAQFFMSYICHGLPIVSRALSASKPETAILSANSFARMFDAFGWLK